MVFSRSEILRSFTVFLIFTLALFTDAASSYESLGSFEVPSPADNIPVEFFSSPSLQDLVNELLPSAMMKTSENYSESQLIKIDSECFLEEHDKIVSVSGFYVLIRVEHSNLSFEVSRCDSFESDVYFINASEGQIFEALLRGLRLIRDRKVKVGKAFIFISPGYPRNLVANTAVICNSTSFYNIATNACVNCTAGCQLCNSITNCLSCSPGSITGTTLTNGYYLNSGKCTQCTANACSICPNNLCTACVQGYALNASNLCTIDKSNCVQYSTSNTCTNCSSGFNLYSGSCVSCSIPICICSSTNVCGTCNSGFYMDNSVSPGVCKSCPSSCQTCSNITCLTCYPGFWFSNGTCLQCSVGCGMCTSANSCTSCNLGYMLMNGVCSVCPSNCYKCVNGACVVCGVGYYWDAHSNSCLPCQSPCLDCSNASYCNLCQTGVAIGGVCNGCGDNCLSCNVTGCTVCVNGYYYDSGSNSCLKCQDGCLACSGAFCLQSMTGFFITNTPNSLYSALPNAALCLSLCDVCNSTTLCISCSIGAFLSSGICYPCSSNCKLCSSLTNCTSCLTGYFLNQDGYCIYSMLGCSNFLQGTCLNCTQGYFYNFTSKTCTQCIQNCVVCLDGISCQVCSQGYYFNVNSCQSCTLGCMNCRNGTGCDLCSLTYYQNSTGGCSKCVTSCNYCQNNTVCLKCAPGFFLDSSGNCFACQTNCYHCTSATQCIQCNSGYTLSTTYTCVAVPPFCSYTNNIVSPNNCIACQTGYYLLSTNACAPCSFAIPNCVSCSNTRLCTQCQDGSFLSLTQASNYLSVCSLCGLNCHSCLSLTYCLNCIAPAVMMRLTTNIVSTTSGVNTGANTTVQTNVFCVLVPSACSNFTVSNSTGTLTCTNCSQGFYLTADGCTACIANCAYCTASGCTNCSLGFYLTSKTCTACIANCLNCSANGCTQCFSGYYLGTGCQACPDNCMNCSGSKCFQCNSNYYLNSGGLCKQCNSPCLTCLDQSNCTSCIAGLFLNPTNNSCNKCGANCLTCSPNNTCSQCNPLYSLNVSGLCLPSNCLLMTPNGCSVCRLGYALNASLCIQTFRCPFQCLQCSDPMNCTACNSTFYVGAMGQCVPCPPSCANGCQNATSCNGCIPGYYNQNGACLPCMRGCQSCSDSTTCAQCVTGTVFNVNRCSMCMSGCASCNDVASCSTCLNGFTLLNNSCVPCADPNCNMCLGGACTSCNAGTYLDSGVCKPCFANCLLCISNSTCTACNSTYYLSSTSTQPTCASCGGYCLTCLSPGVCTSCVNGTYSTSSNTTALATPVNCAVCPFANCLSCNASTCFLCSPGYSVNINGTCSSCAPNCNACSPTGACLHCFKGFYLDSSSVCQPCTANCSLCLDGNSCQLCAKGSILQSDNTCGQCGIGCAVCNDNGVCSNCFHSFQLTNGSCSLCSDSGVYGLVISKNFTQLIVVFNSTIDNRTPNCSAVITTDGDFGAGWSCFGIGMNLVVLFGTNYQFDDSNLVSVYPVGLYKNPCTNSSYENMTAVFAKPPPIPSGVIKGLPMQSVGCNAGNLNYFIDDVSGSANLSVLVSWNATVTPANQQVSNFVQTLNSTRISIPITLFEQINSSITLVADICNSMGRCINCSFTTQLLGAKEMSVAIDLGDAISISCSQALVLNAKIQNACGATNTSTYIWKITSSSNTSAIGKVLNNTKIPYRINLASNDLPPTNFYVITVFVSSGKLNGTSSIIINTTSDPLVCQLNRNDGSISPTVNLTLDGSKSYDPDNNKAKLMYSWDCLDTNTNDNCIGADGNTLVNAVTTPNFTIPASKLVPGSVIVISLTVQTSDWRQSSCNVTLNLIQGLSTDVAIDFHQNFVLPSNSLVLQGKVISTAKAKDNSTLGYVLMWNQPAGQNVVLNNTGLPSLYIPANTLASNQTYVFTLTATEVISNIAASATVQFATSQPPSCVGFLVITPQTGVALTDNFTLSIDSCADNDDTGLPLTYSFGIITQNSSSIYISKGNSFNTATFMLFQGTFTAFVRVCDTLGACSFFQMSSPFTVNPYKKRQLQTQDPIAVFNTLVQSNPDSTVLYGISVITTFVMTASQVSTIYNSVISYVETENIDSDVVNMVMQLTLQIILDQNATLSYNSVNTYTQIILELAAYSIDQLTTDMVNLAIYIYVELIINTNYDMQYTILANTFLDQFTAIYDANMLPGSLILSSTLLNFTFFKIREVSTVYTNLTVNLGNNASVTVQSLPFNSSTLIDLILRIIPEPGGYSNVLYIALANSGTFSNGFVNLTFGTMVSLGGPTVLFQLPIMKNVSKSWGCEYYTGTMWLGGMCSYLNSTNKTVTIKISQAAMFRLYDSNLVVTSTTTSDNKSYAPIVLSAVFGVIFIISYCITSLCSIHDISGKSVSVIAYHNVPVQSDNEVFKPVYSNNAGLTVDGEKNYKVSPEANPHGIESEKLKEEIKSEKSVVKTKTIDRTSMDDLIPGSIRLIGCHLLFGLLIKDPYFSRKDRILAVCLILASQCTIEGALIGYNFKDIERFDSSNVIFALLSVAFTVPLHIADMNLRVGMRRVCSVITVFGFIALIANIVLTIVISIELKLDHMDWILTFFWGLLFELILESFIMVIKYLILRPK